VLNFFEKKKQKTFVFKALISKWGAVPLGIDPTHRQVAAIGDIIGDRLLIA
jgi:hypothetical protein